jgi:hypothetical protein
MTSRIPAIGTCLFALACVHVRADLADILGPRTLASLRSRGELTRSATGSADLRYLPSIDGQAAVRKGVESAQPTVVVELLALAKGPNGRLDNDAGRLAVCNTLRSVSRLQGLEYYSTTQGAMRPLYRASYRIASPDNRRRLEDTVVSAPPDHEDIWVYQDDSTFGGNVYDVSYDNAPRYVQMRVANRTVLRYLLLPLVRPGGMVLYFLIVPDGDEFLFYAVAAVRLLGPWAPRGRMEESFAHRVEAMHSWFVNMLGSP